MTDSSRHAREHGLATIATERLTIEGSSRAGNETWFRVKELGVALDIGRCPDVLVGLRHAFVTHAHLDHALGIPFYAAQRTLQRLPAGNVYLPAETIEGFAELMRLHERLEGTTYEVNLIGLGPGDTHRIRRDLMVRAHRTSHRVISVGWEFSEIRHKLKPEYAGLPEQELAALSRSHGQLIEETAVPLLFYTGDTDRAILETNDALFRSHALMIECSFLMPEHRDRAPRYRHIHLDDIFDFVDRYENDAVILTHFSLRYSAEEIHRFVSARCPERLRGRLRLALPEPYSRC